jgi:hypothetical protein
LVASQQQAPLGFDPDGDRKHTAQARKTRRAPLDESVKNHLGVAASAERYTQSLKLSAQLAMVVNLSIKGDYSVAVWASHRLVAAIEIHNPEPRRSKGDMLSGKTPLLIGPAMDQ